MRPATGQTLCKLRLPAAAPFIFNGLKICTTLALIGAIVAEFFGSPTVGMGFRISTEVGRLALDMVWAEIAVAAVVGSAVLWRVALVERGGDLLASLARGADDEKHGRSTTMIARWVSADFRRSAALLAGGGRRAEDVTLQLKWVTQAQFAGYYVAQAKGFYKDEGLDVTIKPGGPDVAPAQVLAGGGADVIVDWMPSALAAREKGVPLVNIAQPFKRSGMELTCRNDSGVTKTDGLQGPDARRLVRRQRVSVPVAGWRSSASRPTAGRTASRC